MNRRSIFAALWAPFLRVPRDTVSIEIPRGTAIALLGISLGQSVPDIPHKEVLRDELLKVLPYESPGETLPSDMY